MLDDVDVEGLGLRQHPVRGDYFAIAPRHRGRLRSLVYPVAKEHADGLGVLLTVDTAGGMRLGPDATRLEVPAETDVFELDVPARRARAFFYPCSGQDVDAHGLLKSPLGEQREQERTGQAERAPGPRARS